MADKYVIFPIKSHVNRSKLFLVTQNHKIPFLTPKITFRSQKWRFFGTTDLKKSFKKKHQIPCTGYTPPLEKWQKHYIFPISLWACQNKTTAWKILKIFTGALHPKTKLWTNFKEILIHPTLFITQWPWHPCPHQSSATRRSVQSMSICACVWTQIGHSCDSVMLGIETPGMYLVQALNENSKNETVCLEKNLQKGAKFSLYL